MMVLLPNIKKLVIKKRNMKRYLFVVMVLCGFVACKKSGETLNPNIAGKWELRRQSGGWRPDTNFTAGNGNIYQFNSNSTYMRFVNNQLSEHGSFKINKTNNPPNQPYNNIVFY